MTNMAGENLNANVVLSADNQQYDQSMQQSANVTDQLTTSLTSLGNKINQVTRAAGKTLVGVSAADTATITALTASYASWEHQMQSLNAQAGVLGRTLTTQNRMFGEYKTNVNDLRRSFGETTTGAAQLVQTLSKVSDNTASVNQLASTYEKLGKVSGDAPAALAASMTQLQRSMGTSQRDTEKYANQLTVLQSRSNATASSILDFTNSIAPVGRLVGMTQTDIMGFSNAFIKAGQDGYQASNVFNKMITDISGAAKSGSPLLNQYANLVGMTTENFKNLGGTDQILSVFNAINRQGPNAIATLTRMGYDGQRTMRTVTAMSQNGGIAAEIAAARNADPNALNRGYERSSDGIVDNLKKMRAEMAQSSEAMGQNFEAPANALIKTLTGISSAVRVVAESPFGKLASGLMLVAAPMTAIAGTALVASKAIAAFSAVRMMTGGSLGAGFREGRAGAGMMNLEQAQARGYNWVGRPMYNAGNAMSGAFGSGGYVSRAVGYGGQAGGWASRLYGQALYSPGSIRIPGVEGSGGYSDPARRLRMFSSSTMRGSFMGGMYSGLGTISGEREAMIRAEDERLRDKGAKTSGNRYMGSGKSAGNILSDDERRAMAERNVAQREASAGLRGLSRETMTAGAGMRAFSRGLGNTAGLMAGAGMGAARSATSLVGKLGASAYGLVGGNPLLAAGIGAAALWRVSKSTPYQFQDTSNILNPYYQSAGLTAPTPLSTQLAGNKQTAPITMSQALNVSTADNAAAGSGGYKLTNDGLKGKDQKSALAWLSSQWSSLSGNATAINNVAMDLTHLYGQKTAQQMLNTLSTAPQGSEIFANVKKASSPGAHGFWDTTKNIMSGGGYQSGSYVSGGLSDMFGAINAERNQIASTRGTAAALQQKGQRMEQFFTEMTKAGYKGDEKEQNEQVNTALIRQLFGTGIQLTDREAVGAQLTSVSNKGSAGTATSGSLRSWLNQAVTNKTWSFLTGDSLRQALSSQGLDESLTGDKAAAALYSAIINPKVTAADQSSGVNAQTAIGNRSRGMFGAGGVLQRSSVNYALNGGSENNNAQYAAIYDIANTVQGSGRGIGGQIRYLTNLGAQTGGDNSMGYSLFQGASSVLQQRMGYQAPYQSMTQNYGQQAQLWKGVMSANMGPDGQQQREAATANFAQQTQDMYNYFKQELYQQREFNVQRERGEEDYNLQRGYAAADFHTSEQRAIEDYNLSRKRAESDFNLSRERNEDDFNLQRQRSTRDFNLSRRRQEQDFNHQLTLQAEQAAKSMYNIYDRVRVQRTHSAGFLAVNGQDQLKRMREQEADLKRLRHMGVSNDVIQQLDLTNPQNQQQLSRFVADMSSNPDLVKQFNQQIKDRLSAAAALVRDKSSSDWQEMQYEFNLQRDRSQRDFQTSMNRSYADFNKMETRQSKDFNKSMARQNKDFQTQLSRTEADFGKSMGRMATAFSTQMTRANEDMDRQATTIDGNFESILSQATTKLSGHAAAQAATVLKEFRNLRKDSKGIASDIMVDLAAIFGVHYTPPKNTNNGSPATNHNATNNGNRGPKYSENAAGGVLPGYSPGRDNLHFEHPQLGTLSLSGGEAIMVPEWTQAVGGEKAVKEMNRRARRGFASGGVFNPLPGSSIQRAMKETYKGHDGLDLNVGSGWDDYGMKYYAAVPGVISYVGWNHGYGDAVFENTKYGRLVYGHASQVHVKAGQKVKAGQWLGNVGDTGRASAPHLHFGFPGGTPQQAYSLLMGAASAGYLGGDVGGQDAPLATLDSITKKRYRKLEKDVQTMAGLQALGGGDMSGIINQFAHLAYNKYARKYKKAHPADEALNFGSVPNEPQGNNSNQALVKKAAHAYGWDSQWPSLYQLVQHESGFNNRAQNPTSSAYGMFQFLDSTWAGVGGHKTSDPWLQSVYGMKYIKNRYQGPNDAWSKWQSRSPHWYKDGAVFNGAQTIGVGEAGPEAVIPLNDRGADFMSDVFAKTNVGHSAKQVATAGYSQQIVNNYQAIRIDRSTTFAGPITVQANDPNAMVKELQAKQRQLALTQASIGGQRV
jgi:TP901 family phage tail tape measure protein